MATLLILWWSSSAAGSGQRVAAIGQASSPSELAQAWNAADPDSRPGLWTLYEARARALVRDDPSPENVAPLLDTDSELLRRLGPEVLPVASLVELMLCGQSGAVRRVATRLLRQIEIYDAVPVHTAILDRLRYEPDGVAPHVAAAAFQLLPWFRYNIRDHTELVADLVRWMVDCDLRGLRLHRDEIAFTLVALTGRDRPVPQTWQSALHLWAERFGVQALEVLMTEHGVVGVERYATVLAQEQRFVRAQATRDTDTLARFIYHAPLSDRAVRILEGSVVGPASRSVVRVWHERGPARLPELKWTKSQARTLLGHLVHEAHAGDPLKAEAVLRSPSLCLALDQPAAARDLLVAHLVAEQHERPTPQVFLDQALGCVLDTPQHSTVNSWLTTYAHYRSVQALRRVLSSEGLLQVPHYKKVLRRSRRTYEVEQYRFEVPARPSRDGTG